MNSTQSNSTNPELKAPSAHKQLKAKPRLPGIADLLIRYGNYLVPFVLIGLGVLILIDSHTLENRGLAVLTLVVSCLWLLTLAKGFFQSLQLAPQLEKN
jgi:hypothetical protein